MVVNSNADEQQYSVATMAIHINTLRTLISCLLPMAAKNANDPSLWIAQFEALALRSADYAAFEASGAVDPELMKAAVISSLEEILGAAKRAIIHVQG
ncbi:MULTISPECIES: hypothetical protein [Novosphingobium]|jgi:hypothetical protein|uniref:Uncharacterized protein n=1 Tax=Novosphingobium subterraneum TaxID=48936 RepID=A0A0B8ZUT6_9SPHN|nr:MULTISPECIES: hypothetical protein [Novosphingobium]KHS42006.1 hypothetical protein NJ75_04372 [Novosphingobium subterraneum]QOV96336.1 hypothetical protein IM701_18780 [Novosphingobium sp. ES2-1]